MSLSLVLSDRCPCLLRNIWESWKSISTFDITGVKIKLKGKAHVSWSTGSGKNRRHYSATEDYIDAAIVLFGPGDVFNLFFINTVCLFHRVTVIQVHCW